MAKSPKVVPSNELHSRRLDALMHREVDPAGLFDIPFEDVRRVQDSSNESLSDQVLLGSRAMAAVQRLFGAFGVVGIPETWGQLAGAISYCEMLNVMCSGPSDQYAEEAAVKTMQSNCPELVPSILAMQKKDFEALREISRTTLTLPVMSSHFDTVQECWVPRSVRRAG